jgi:hypothetical protein
MTKPKSIRAIVIALSLAAVAVAVLATTMPAAAHGGRRDGLDPVRVATGKYFDLDIAQAAGYALLADKAGITCIDNPGIGAMGVHYANGALLDAGVIDAAKPQVLVYAPQRMAPCAWPPSSTSSSRPPGTRRTRPPPNSSARPSC